MPTERQDFCLWLGETRKLIVTVTDCDENPINLAGANIIWAMQMQHKDGPIEVRKQTGDGITITDPTNGIFEVLLEPADTQDLPTGRYYHEAEVMDASGNVAVIFTGSAVLLPSIT